MSRYLETIQLKDGEFKRLDYHQCRMNRVHDLFFPDSEILDLKEILVRSDYPLHGLFKCRLVYAEKVELVQFLEYSIRPIRSLSTVEIDIPSLEYKPEDRTLLNQAHNLGGDSDDVIIVVNGLVKDSWYCNLAFWDGAKWLTPIQPLISGVNRQSLIDQHMITECVIPAEELLRFTKVRLFNAMIEFGELELELPTCLRK